MRKNSSTTDYCTPTVEVLVRVLHGPQCVVERLAEDDAGGTRVGCEVTAGDPAHCNFSWSGDHSQSHQQSHNYSVLRLPSSSGSLLQQTKIRCAVRNSVGWGECHLTIPASLAVLNYSTSVIILIIIPAILFIIITSLAVVFCLNKLATRNQKYFVSGRSN